MKNTTNTVRTICEVGLFAALGFVFDEFQGLFFGTVFPNGGSIGFAMIAVLIIAYRRGFLAGLLTGLIMGLFDIATKAYVIHPLQVLLDYIFPYMLVGLAGLFKPLFDKADGKGHKILWLLVGTLVGGLLKLSSHYLAGVVYWADPEYFAWNLNTMSPYLYCFVYNIAFIGPSIVITGALLVVVYLTAPRVLTNKPFVEEVKDSKNTPTNKKYLPVILSSFLITAGTFLFVYFFVDWLKSFYYKESSQKYYFSQESMVIYVLGIFIAILGLICLVSYFKNKFNYIAMSSVLVIISFVSFMYSVDKIVEAYQEQSSPDRFWIWFIVASFGLVATIVFLSLSIVNKKKQEDVSNI